MSASGNMSSVHDRLSGTRPRNHALMVPSMSITRFVSVTVSYLLFVGAVFLLPEPFVRSELGVVLCCSAIAAATLLFVRYGAWTNCFLLVSVGPASPLSRVIALPLRREFFERRLRLIHVRGRWLGSVHMTWGWVWSWSDKPDQDPRNLPEYDRSLDSLVARVFDWPYMKDEALKLRDQYRGSFAHQVRTSPSPLSSGAGSSTDSE